MNILQHWEIAFRRETLRELKVGEIEITLENIPKIIKEMSYEVRSGKYPEKCLCYKDNKPCHSNIENLNCFVCPCPNYNTETTEGGCGINSKKGKWANYKSPGKGRVWDCSDCTFGHSPSYVAKFIKENLSELQKEYENIVL